jgi:hypothetical protein
LETAGSRSARDALLIVCEAVDPAIRETAERLQSSGAVVEIVPDVYAAMAHLSTGAGKSRVLVDVRTLDRREAAFISLAPRYFPDIQLEVISLPGTDERMIDLGPRPGLVTLESLVQGIAGGNLSAAVKGGGNAAGRFPEDGAADDGCVMSLGTPEEEYGLEDLPSDPVHGEVGPAEFAPPAAPPQSPLSTDGGPGADPGPAIHEVVRQRMARDDLPAVRRKPPAPATIRPSAADAAPQALLREEMDALLADEPPASGPEPRPGRGGQ